MRRQTTAQAGTRPEPPIIQLHRGGLGWEAGQFEGLVGAHVADQGLHQPDIVRYGHTNHLGVGAGLEDQHPILGV